MTNPLTHHVREALLANCKKFGTTGFVACQVICRQHGVSWYEAWCSDRLRASARFDVLDSAYWKSIGFLEMAEASRTRAEHKMSIVQRRTEQ